ncbi:MAG TPA: polysaccharide deacetylase family protein [Acidimicrobiales bacterium]|nr:polysaccharide deacetylase family protein [Acidimicrobiales bacterium]
MHPRTVYVTTSWDDGHELDLRLASELTAHGMAGTFYLAPRCREIPSAKRLGPSAICELAERHEIGAHTLTHPRLTDLPAHRARSEILGGKDAIENSIGRRVTSFCYPYGAYGEEHPAMVRTAGFTVARTVDRFRTGPPSDLLRMGTTVHASRHLVDGPHVLRRARSPRQAVALWRNWDLLGRRLFEEVRSNGGVFHLWGHSWEIDANDDWRRLRSVLDELADQDVVFLTNGELATELQGAS